MHKLIKVLVILVSIINVVFWFLLTLGSFFLGGKTGPPNFVRTIPILNVQLFALAIVGAIINLNLVIKKYDSSAIFPIIIVIVTVILACMAVFSMGILEIFYVALFFSLIPLLYCLKSN